jgi:hypothetical protein
MKKKSTLNKDETNGLMTILQERFEKNRHRHATMEWSKIADKLLKHPNKLLALHAMEATGGEPDVLWYNKDTHEYTFVDCATESPIGRRSLCYDEAALNARKENKPKGSAQGMSNNMGIELLNEEQYRALQQLGHFDLKTSSWLYTPEKIRKLGGAIFGDFRFDTVFIYHNGAESYYAARGFRGFLII